VEVKTELTRGTRRVCVGQIAVVYGRLYDCHSVSAWSELYNDCSTVTSDCAMQPVTPEQQVKMNHVHTYIPGRQQ